MAEDMTTDLTTEAPQAAGTGASQGSGTGAKSTGAIAKVKETASQFAGQATDAARSAATEGKDRATELLGSVAKVVENAAQMVEDNVGPTYGNYARKAATGVSDFAETLQNKDVDALVADAREFVRKSPLVAIGAAVAVGFALTRVVKIGADADTSDA